MRLSRFNPPRTTPVSQMKFHPRMRLILATVCALFLGVSAFAETPAVGAKAPDFTLSTPTGKAVKMSKKKGDTASFWWCCAVFQVISAPTA